MAKTIELRCRVLVEDNKDFCDRLEQLNGRLARRGFDPLSKSEYMRLELGFFNGDAKISELAAGVRKGLGSKILRELKNAIYEEDGKRVKKP